MSEHQTVWGHSQTVTRSRGKTKVQCRCGKQSGHLDDEGIENWITEHRRTYGLVERVQGRRPQ